MESIKMGKLALDLYDHKVDTKYSNIETEAQAEDILRNALIDAIGCKPGEDGFYYAFQENKPKFFKIVAETITETTRRITKEYFADWVEYKDYAFGEKPEFKVKDDQLFKVSVIATGMHSLRRQKMYGKRIGSEAFTLGIKIYEEFFDFMLGEMSWAECVDKVAESFTYELAKLISKAFFNAYEFLNGEVTAAAYSDDVLIEKVREIENLTGKKCAIYGTATALDNIVGANALADYDDKRNFGYVKIFKGRQCVELPQMYNEDLGANEVPDDVLLIIPAGEKVLKAGFEGQPVVASKTDVNDREDMQVEYSFLRRCHVGVAVASKFGMLKIG